MTMANGRNAGNGGTGRFFGNLRRGLGSLIYGRDALNDERGKMVEALRRASEMAGEIWTPGSGVFMEVLKETLKEVDASSVFDLVASLDPAFGLGYGIGLETERLATVARSRQAWRIDPITQWIVQVWTNFAYGENIEMTVIKPAEESETESKAGGVEEQESPEVLAFEEASAVIQEFWSANRNYYVLGQDRLQRLSDTLLVDGEIYLILYVSEIDGTATIRYCLTDEIIDIVTDPGDAAVPVYYNRQYNDSATGLKSLYYMDWLTAIETDGEGRPDILPKGSKTANGEKEKTFVCMIHVPLNSKTGMRGWPLMTAGLPWAREHKRFREYRTAVAAGVAQWINKLKVQGGSRAIDQARARLNSSMVNSGYKDTNPPAAAGSTFLENQAAELSRLPLTTGAADAKTDGEALLLMTGLGGGLFPHWIGAGDAYRLATATSMEAPLLREFSRYQNFWAAIFRSVARVILWAAGKWGKSENLTNNYQAVKIDVSTDRLVEVDLVAISGAISQLFTGTLIPMLNLGAINPEVVQDIAAQVWLNALQAIGAQDAGKIAAVSRFRPESSKTEPPENGGNGDDGNEFPEGLIQDFDPESIMGKIAAALDKAGSNINRAFYGKPPPADGGNGDEHRTDTIDAIARVSKFFAHDDDSNG